MFLSFLANKIVTLTLYNLSRMSKMENKANPAFRTEILQKFSILLLHWWIQSNKMIMNRFSNSLNWKKLNQKEKMDFWLQERLRKLICRKNLSKASNPKAVNQIYQSFLMRIKKTQFRQNNPQISTKTIKEVQDHSKIKQKKPRCLKDSNYTFHNHWKKEQKILLCRKDNNFCVRRTKKSTKLYKKEWLWEDRTLTYLMLSMQRKKRPISIESRTKRFEYQRKRLSNKNM